MKFVVKSLTNINTSSGNQSETKNKLMMDDEKILKNITYLNSSGKVDINTE